LDIDESKYSYSPVKVIIFITDPTAPDGVEPMETEE
jgi:hypothetical protein